MAAVRLSRVALELGGKSTNVILPGADMGAAVKVLWSIPGHPPGSAAASAQGSDPGRPRFCAAKIVPFPTPRPAR
jgi:hypothetical protein